MWGDNTGAGLLRSFVFNKVGRKGHDGRIEGRHLKTVKGRDGLSQPSPSSCVTVCSHKCPLLQKGNVNPYYSSISAICQAPAGTILLTIAYLLKRKLKFFEYEVALLLANLYLHRSEAKVK